MGVDHDPPFALCVSTDWGEEVFERVVSISIADGALEVIYTSKVEGTQDDSTVYANGCWRKYRTFDMLEALCPNR